MRYRLVVPSPPTFRLAAALVALAATAASPAQQPVDFQRDVRPVLSRRCYACHGPDAQARKADLRLDRGEGAHGAFAARDGRPAVVPGDVTSSELWHRVTSEDRAERMPPRTAHQEPMTAGELATLRAWIEAGARYEQHWAFVPPEPVDAPANVVGPWGERAIDRLVSARLARAGLTPKPEADRRTLIRRVTFDLTGLPPTPAEIRAFLDDRAPRAYERLVDRLLQRPQFGEHMARYWLDAVRFADTNGVHHDHYRELSPYRDFVIRAFADNLPFDDFLRYQLAGDLFPDPVDDQRIASGFHRLHLIIDVGTALPEESHARNVIDRVNAFGTVFLGLTVGCAQCHDHKYDPISQREFYSFYGFFNSIKERDNGSGRNPKPAIAAPDEDQLAKLRDLEARIEMLKQRLEQDDPITDRFQTTWEQATRERLGAPIAWTAMKPTEFMARYGSRLVLQDDLSVLATGPTPSRDTYDLVFAPGKRKIQAIRIEVLPDPTMPHGASGRADDGRFILSRLTSRMTSVSDSSDPPLIAYALAEADIN
ncbi:MAG: DUF1549 domain-containing protein, partial [Planctomycetes bacterium]|nr:DUF1549 domain-containing protein [Planctomycetota bacterium]